MRLETPSSNREDKAKAPASPMWPKALQEHTSKRQAKENDKRNNKMMTRQYCQSVQSTPSQELQILQQPRLLGPSFITWIACGPLSWLVSTKDTMAGATSASESKSWIAVHCTSAALRPHIEVRTAAFPMCPKASSRACCTGTGASLSNAHTAHIMASPQFFQKNRCHPGSNPLFARNCGVHLT